MPNHPDHAVIADLLQHAELWGLTVEVVCAAVQIALNNPGYTVEECAAAASAEWDL